MGARHLLKGKEMFDSWHVPMPPLRHKNAASGPTTLQTTRKRYKIAPKAKNHSWEMFLASWDCTVMLDSQSQPQLLPVKYECKIWKHTVCCHKSSVKQMFLWGNYSCWRSHFKVSNNCHLFPLKKWKLEIKLMSLFPQGNRQNREYDPFGIFVANIFR